MAYLVYIIITVVGLHSGERPVNYCKFRDR